MKIKLFICFLSVLFLGTCSPTKKSKRALARKGLPYLEKQKDCDLDLYVCLGELSRKSKFFIKNNNINSVGLILGSEIYLPNEAKLNLKGLERGLNRVFPNPKQKGIGVLDWEGKGMEILKDADPQSKEFKQVVAEFKKAMNYAKRKRPNVKWGFYGLPTRNYWQRTATWEKQNQALGPIIECSDIVCPSIYDFYDDNTQKEKVRDSLYVNDNIVEALKLGTRFNKPVLPFVWHRYHPSNKKKSEYLIPKEEFSAHIKAALNANYKNKNIRGLIWWGADKYGYNTQNKAVRREVAKARNFDSYQNEIVVNYAARIYSLMREHCEQK